MMSKHATTTKGMSHFMLFLLRLLALALFIYSVLMEDDHTHEYIDPAFRYGRKKKKKRRRRL